MKIEKIPTIFPDVFIIKPEVFGDERGFFLESYNEKEYHKIGINAKFVQDNHSYSNKGVLRGLHFQNPNTQGKLIRVLQGAVFDVIVDIRPSSLTFKKHLELELSADNKKMLWIPPGFAHGFLTLEDNTHFTYKCTDYYFPKNEFSILWNSDEFEINWKKLNCQYIISDKDKKGRPLRDFLQNELPQ